MPLVDQARVACDESRWGDAWRLFSVLPVDELDIDDLDRSATAAYLTGHDEEGFSQWVRAHQRCVTDGAVHRAAHFGGKLAQGFAFKGDLGRCRGWVDRTGHLLDDAGIDCVEQGYLECGTAMLSIFEDGDITGAHAHFVQAGKIGARFGQRELITLARIGEGRTSIYLGDLTEGMALLDEATVSIEAGELSTLATGDAYCTVIDACAELSDIGRLRAWTESFTHWCDGQQELVLYRGHCFLHRAEMLTILGSWREALVEARRACDRLADPIMPSVLGAANALEGDVLRLVGDLDGAEAAYRRAGELGHDPQPGLSLLRLAQGRLDAADAMIRRVLHEARDPISRSRVLGSFVEIALAAGDVDAAGSAADELRDVAAAFGAPLLRARATSAAGMVHFADGDEKEAIVELRHAFNELNELGARYEAARSRVVLAQVCDALGDHDAAESESIAARAALESFRREPGVAARTPGPDGLTQRELEVLRLLARGHTNRAIAEELVLSEKTVASHVSHIFTKTGVTSRSGATAYAYDHDLV